MTITLGWWAIPLAITIIAFLASFMADTRSSSGYLSGIDTLIFNALALIVSLIAWLIWSVLT
jgi:hypothetical protein